MEDRLDDDLLPPPAHRGGWTTLLGRLRPAQQPVAAPFRESDFEPPEWRRDAPDAQLGQAE